LYFCKYTQFKITHVFLERNHHDIISLLIYL